MNHFVWNMRYPDSNEAIINKKVLSEKSIGPLATPGKYSVTLEIDGETFRQSFNLITDPRIKTKQSDFVSQFNLLIDIRNKENQLITGIIKNSFQITAFDKKGNLNSNFIKKYKSVSKKNDHVVLISEEGEISSILANGLVENLDMKNVYSLRGGIKEWIKKGNPVVK